MCLIIIKDKEPPTERVVVYKVVKKWQGFLLAPFYSSYRYTSGCNEAIGQVSYGVTVTLVDKKRFINKEGQINGGVLHCYLFKIDAELHLDAVSSDHLIVIGYGEPEDFVAWGTNEVAFKKIYISEEEIKRALC
jgi:hypothetical protein